MKKVIALAVISFIFFANYIGNISRDRLPSMDDTYVSILNEGSFYISRYNKWQEEQLIGVNLSPSKPGYFQSENKVTEQEYLTYIKYIYDMGANCIKVPNIMGHEFYDALKSFNGDKEKPMYILQGIYFDEVNLKDGYDASNGKLEELYKENIKYVVDSVHGNTLNSKNMDITNIYKNNVSEYVIGYVLGVEFSSRDIIYTEIMNEPKEFKGKYIYPKKEASIFEAYLATLGDFLATYELKEYDAQKPIGFVGSSPYKILEAKEDSLNQVNEESLNETITKTGDLVKVEPKETYIKVDKDYIDVENIQCKKNFKPGIFVSYNMYPTFTNLKEYENKLEEFFEKLSDYHEIPVVIGEFGIPASRAAGEFTKNENKGYITEEEQGAALVEIQRSLEDSNFAGSFIFEFLDSWNRTNAKENRVEDREKYWSDGQSYSQGFGLMAFEPGNDNSISYPDETIEEWSDKDILSSNDKYTLSMKNDEKYIYFMVKAQDNIDLLREDIYIDLDVTPKSGTRISSQYDLAFEEPVDFIIKIQDLNNSSVVVQKYYNRFNFDHNKSQNLKRPDLMNYEKDMDEFSPILIEVRPKMYLEALSGFAEKVSSETGKLIHGNGNPLKEEYNSASDFYVGDNYVEVRIPYGLLNFMDPSNRIIQDDFYEVLQSKPLSINHIKVGLTVKKDNVNFSRITCENYDIHGWHKPNYHERLKKSYFIIKDYLRR